MANPTIIWPSVTAKPKYRINQNWFIAYGKKDQNQEVVGHLLEKQPSGAAHPLKLIGLGRPVQPLNAALQPTDWALLFEGLKPAHVDGNSPVCTVWIYQTTNPSDPGTIQTSSVVKSAEVYYFRQPLNDRLGIHKTAGDRPDHKSIDWDQLLKVISGLLQLKPWGITGDLTAQAGSGFHIYGTHNDPYPSSLQCQVTSGANTYTGQAETVTNPASQFSFYFSGVPAGNYESYVLGSQTHFGSSIAVS